MAITRAQQVRQMLEKGGRLGLFRGALADTKGGKAMSPGTSADYSPGQGNRQDREKRGGPPGGGDPKMKYTAPPKDYDRSKDTGPDRFKLAEQNRIKAEEEARRKKEIDERRQKQIDDFNKTQIEKLKKDRKFKTFEQKTLQDLLRDEEEEDKDVKPSFFDRVKGSIRDFVPPSASLIEGITDLIPGRKLSDMYVEYGGDYKNFDDYQRDVLAGKISTKGGPMGGYFRDRQGNLIKSGGQDQPIVPIVPTTTGIASTDVVDNRTELEKLLDARGAAYRFFADGGRADDEEDYVGGIMDLESARQMYGLGKLVKKVTRGVKKIAKSPIGKAALLGFAGNALMGGGLKSFLLGAKGPPGIAKTGILQKMFLKNPSLGFSLGNISPYAGIVGSSLFAGLMTPKEQEEEEAYLGPSIDIPGIRKNPYAAMGETYRFYADGGKAEPVAKKTMPLLDMDGMEKDYRKDGGFVPIGRMERADDVPARLSKNEFVFTADAVRNAGDGDVDKGAEVMYNMMKNLEAGGNVSEESQGLDGARKMFQTSQRLEEVL